MRKFEVQTTHNMFNTQVFKIVDDNHNYLHSDGTTLSCGEYWPTREQAQAVLDKFRPPRVWKHGDVFESPYLSKKVVIYIERENKGPVCACFDSFNYCNVAHAAERCVIGATFLYNIKDKL